jgi:hypothetical protein
VLKTGGHDKVDRDRQQMLLCLEFDTLNVPRARAALEQRRQRQDHRNGDGNRRRQEHDWLHVGFCNDTATSTSSSILFARRAYAETGEQNVRGAHKLDHLISLEWTMALTGHTERMKMRGRANPRSTLGYFHLSGRWP